jgi:hypothetical protein
MLSASPTCRDAPRIVPCHSTPEAWLSWSFDKLWTCPTSRPKGRHIRWIYLPARVPENYIERVREDQHALPRFLQLLKSSVREADLSCICIKCSALVAVGHTLSPSVRRLLPFLMPDRPHFTSHRLTPPHLTSPHSTHLGKSTTLSSFVLAASLLSYEVSVDGFTSLLRALS